jgi:hypothetical protein
MSWPKRDEDKGNVCGTVTTKHISVILFVHTLADVGAVKFLLT